MDCGDMVKVINKNSVFFEESGQIVGEDYGSFQVLFTYYPSRIFEDQLVFFDEHELELVP